MIRTCYYKTTATGIIADCRWIVLLMLLLAGLSVAAQSESEEGDYLLSESTYNALNDIHELLEAGNHAAALTELRSLERKVDGNEYEQAVVWQTMGYAYNGLDRPEEAAGSFIRAVESGALPPDVNHRLDYFIAQLLAQSGDYSRAIEYLERWFTEEDDPDLNAYRLAAGLYYQTGNHDQVIRYARRAISKSAEADEDLYQLLLASYFEKKDYTSAASLLKQMLELFPTSKSYWKQLYATYQLLDREKEALAVYELAYRRGLLDRKEKEELARLYLHLQAPYRAARFLERELDAGGIERNAENLKLLAESYYLARETERAIEAYGQAAAVASDGELYFRQGQLLAQQERWEGALTALQRALEQGGLEHGAQARLLLGIAAYKLDRDDVATEALRQASENRATRKQAEYWLQQIRQQG